MNAGKHVKTSSQYSPSFPPVNLFSVPALLSPTSPTPGPGYIFTFLHQGRSQQAVLEKTFVTGLEKDNVRITWEEATRELLIGCILNIDVTLVKSSPLKELWLVFGLYFSSINTNLSQFQDVMLNSSRAKFLKFECQMPKSVVMEANYLKSSSNKCLTGDETLYQTLDGDASLGGAIRIDHTFQTLQNEKFVKLNDGNSKNVKEDFNDDNSVNTMENLTNPQENLSTMENLTNPQENLSSSTLDNYVTAVNTSGLVLDDSMDDGAHFFSFGSVMGEHPSKLTSQSLISKDLRDSTFPHQAHQNNDTELYFDSLFLSTASHSATEDIEAQFDSVMAANELLENYDEFVKDFENIYKTACSQSCESEANMSNNSLVPSISYSSQPHKKPEKLPVSSVAEESLMQTSNSVESPELPTEQWKYGSFILQPSVTSTPLEKKLSEEDLNTCPLSVSNNPFLPVKMDSGYYESFSPESLPSPEHDVQVHPKHAKNNLVNLLDFWRGKEKILK